MPLKHKKKNTASQIYIWKVSYSNTYGKLAIEYIWKVSYSNTYGKLAIVIHMES